MMKKSIFTLVLMAVMGYVSAQSLQFELNGHIYSDGEEVVCTNDEYGYGEYIQHMQLRNLTSDELNVVVKKEVIEDLEGTMNFFCWGSCFGPDVFVSPNPVPLAGNTVTDDQALSFHTMFDEGVFGKVQVKYSAYDERHPEDAVTINVIFHKSGVGVQESPAVHVGQPYPNPASSMVNFDCNLQGGNVTAVVYNLLGQEVMRQDVNTFEGKLNLSVADLNDGIYFCSVMRDGQNSATVKFVVKK